MKISLTQLVIFIFNKIFLSSSSFFMVFIINCKQGSMSTCSTNDDCPFLYFCDEGTKCIHNPIFPLQIYPTIIYCLIPIASGLVNMTGNSMGIFKVLLLMNLLRYHVDLSTIFIHPMVAGTALPNFFRIVRKKHPSKNTSIVDYNLIYILIPCCLLGSTLGAFIHNFIPQIAQHVLSLIFFSNFALKFWKKFKSIKVTSKSDKIQNEQNPTEKLIKKEEEKDDSEQFQMKKKKIQEYESSIHIPDILRSFLVLVVFQFFVFLVQGKLPFYEVGHCTPQYFLGLTFLILLTTLYLFLIRKRLNRIFNDYKEIGYTPNIDLSERKKFIMIALGGFCAGLSQGIIGVGSGTFIMAVLLTYDLNPRVASATSGYQIFFIGTASFSETFINEKIELQDAGFLFGICAIFGGAVTYIFSYLLKKRDQNVVNRLLVLVLFIFCMMSLIGVFPSAIQTVIEFGWDKMIHVQKYC